MTEQELAQERARTEGERIALRWQRKHIADFKESPEAADLLQRTMAQNNLPFTDEGLEAAFQACITAGYQDIFMPPPPPQNLLDEAAPIPSWFPKMETMDDVNKIPHGKFRELYSGKAGREFRARLDAIGKGIKNG